MNKPLVRIRIREVLSVLKSLRGMEKLSADKVRKVTSVAFICVISSHKKRQV